MGWKPCKIFKENIAYMIEKLRYYKVLMQSLLFNLRFLPFQQAKHLPILLYNPHLIDCTGGVEIKSGNIYRGMIKLGIPLTPKYPQNGITLEIRGKLVFRGSCTIGNDSFISVGKLGRLTIGNNLIVTAAMKVVCAKSITIGDNVLLGWETTLMDTSFHPLFNRESNSFMEATREIVIGDNNWTGMQTLVMPGVITPPNCVFGARSVVTRNGQYQSYCLYGGAPIRKLKSNVERIHGHDNIVY